MIYQITTRNRLCGSKRYFKNKREAREHINNIIRKTHKFYSSLLFPQRLLMREIEDGINVLTIDENILPQWKIILGEEKEITNPIISTTDQNIE